MELSDAKQHLDVRFTVIDSNKSPELDTGDTVWFDRNKEGVLFLNVSPPDGNGGFYPEDELSLLDESTWGATIAVSQKWLDRQQAKINAITKRIEQAQRAVGVQDEAR